MKAHLKQFRVSPKKANLVADLVRNKKVSDAVNILRFTPKKTAPVLRKLIESAAANAENNFKQNKESLYIKEIIVNQGPTYKRSVPVSRGRAHPILKRTSHITVTVEQGSAKPKAEHPAGEKAQEILETKQEASTEKPEVTKSEKEEKSNQ